MYIIQGYSYCITIIAIDYDQPTIHLVDYNYYMCERKSNKTWEQVNIYLIVYLNFLIWL